MKLAYDDVSHTVSLLALVTALMATSRGNQQQVDVPCVRTGSAQSADQYVALFTGAELTEW